MTTAMCSPTASWSKVRGPLGATIMTLKRLHGKFVNTVEIAMRRGETLLLPSTSPRLAKLAVREGWTHVLSTHIAEQLVFLAGR